MGMARFQEKRLKFQKKLLKCLKMNRRKMLKTGAAWTSAALIAPAALANSACSRSRIRVPSYLEGYQPDHQAP
jgi:hypothetical protein